MDSCVPVPDWEGNEEISRCSRKYEVGSLVKKKTKKNSTKIFDGKLTIFKMINLKIFGS